MTMLPIGPGQPGFNIGQIPTTQFNIPAPKQGGGGMFGGGGKKALSVLAEALAAYSAGMGNRGGMAVLQGMNDRRQSARDAEAGEEQYQRQRSDGMADWMAKQEYEQAHPSAQQPTQTDRYIAELMDPNGDPERKKMLSQVLFPPVMGVVNGVPSMIDRASMFSAGGGAAAPQVQPGHVEEGFRFKGGNPGDPNAWEPVNGGPTPPASGGFLGL